MALSKGKRSGQRLKRNDIRCRFGVPNTCHFRIATMMMIIVITSISAIGFTSLPVNACEASAPAGPSQEQYDNSAAIFSGRVVNIQNFTVQSNNDWHLASFEVNRYWKTTNDANDYRQIIVFTAPDSGGCGYEFEVGKAYLVYAVKWSYDPNYLYTSIGYRNEPIEDAQKDLAFLGEGREPTRTDMTWQDQKDRIKIQLPPTGQEEQAISSVISIIGIGVAIAGAAAFFSLRTLKEKK